MKKAIETMMKEWDTVEKRTRWFGKHQVENYEVETTGSEVRIQLAGLKTMEMGEEEGKWLLMV